jgi:imidazole glycerol-phosphate synthase subunit HisH
MALTAIIDYGAGNLRSVQKALQTVAPSNMQCVVTADPAVIQTASALVLPGVGSFGACMKGLQSVHGLREALLARTQHVPFLGICVGMQMLVQQGHEYGTHQGLGVLAGEVQPLPQCGQRLPHMGWNTLHNVNHPLLQGLERDAWVYFVHSYHVCNADPATVAAQSYCGVPFVAALARDNMLALQFHPEKSQRVGLSILDRFLRWNP